MRNEGLGVKSVVHFMGRYAAGDEILFQHAGLLTGRVERVRFEGRRVFYQVTATLTFEVPSSAVVGREAEVIGETE